LTFQELVWCEWYSNRFACGTF